MVLIKSLDCNFFVLMLENCGIFNNYNFVYIIFNCIEIQIYLYLQCLQNRKQIFKMISNGVYLSIIIILYMIKVLDDFRIFVELLVG